MCCGAPSPQVLLKAREISHVVKLLYGPNLKDVAAPEYPEQAEDTDLHRLLLVRDRASSKPEQQQTQPCQHTPTDITSSAAGNRLRHWPADVCRAPGHVTSI